MILYPHCRLKYTKIPQSWTAGHWAAQLFTKGKWFLIHCHSLSQPMKRLKPVTFHLQNLWNQQKDFNWILQLSKVFICLSTTHLSRILNTSKIKTMFLEIHFLQRLAGVTTYFCTALLKDLRNVKKWTTNLDFLHTPLHNVYDNSLT